MLNLDNIHPDILTIKLTKEFIDDKHPVSGKKRDFPIYEYYSDYYILKTKEDSLLCDDGTYFNVGRFFLCFYDGAVDEDEKFRYNPKISEYIKNENFPSIGKLIEEGFCIEFENIDFHIDIRKVEELEGVISVHRVSTLLNPSSRAC